MIEGGRIAGMYVYSIGRVLDETDASPTNADSGSIVTPWIRTDDEQFVIAGGLSCREPYPRVSRSYACLRRGDAHEEQRRAQRVQCFSREGTLKSSR